jgi:sulfonate transport system ATP-binding protein
MTSLAHDRERETDAEAAVPRAVDARGASVELTNVAKEFSGRAVLQSLNLRIAAGEFVAVVGRSGSGKSTLLRLIAGLEAPTSGTVLCNGHPIDGLNRHARMMFQDARLLPWLRVAQNVAVGQAGLVNEAVQVAMKQVGLEERGQDWPAILSGGQRQRVALARALISNPSLLLLDEPLGSLDALTRIEMQNLIQALWQRRACTAVLVTHDIEEAVLLADRVLLLEGGGIRQEFPVALGRPRDRAMPEFQELVRQILGRVLVNDPAGDAPEGRQG